MHLNKRHRNVIEQTQSVTVFDSVQCSCKSFLSLIFPCVEVTLPVEKFLKLAVHSTGKVG